MLICCWISEQMKWSTHFYYTNRYRFSENLFCFCPPIFYQLTYYTQETVMKLLISTLLWLKTIFVVLRDNWTLSVWENRFAECPLFSHVQTNMFKFRNQSFLCLFTSLIFFWIKCNITIRMENKLEKPKSWLKLIKTRWILAD